jgi:serine/threonine protein kinase
VTALEPGDPPRVGRYRLLRRLGSGGMGRVFLGQSPGGRLVAVKLIRPELAADPEFRARFAREVAAARNVSGMFTAAVVDADPEGPQPWLVTAYVPGPSLSDAVRKHGPLPAGSVLTLAAGLAEGLGAVHAAGMVHRDLKPSNVLLASDGPRIIDFGISRAADATALTRADLVVGSPGFMSPEQAMGLEVGPASDVFSLGAVITFAATGAGPFGTGSATALLYRVVHDPPETDRLPAEVQPVAAACLAKEPSQRPTCEQLLAQLGSAQPAANWLPWPVATEAAYPRSAAAAQPWTLTEPYAPPQPAPDHPAGQEAVPGQAEPAPPPAPRAQDLGPTRVLGQVPVPAPRPGRPSGPGQPASSRPPTSASPRASSRPSASARRPGQRRVARWAAAALLAVAGLVAIVLALTRPASSSQGSPPPPPGPRAVVVAYFAAINAHKWHRVWDLGGRNLSPSYQAMVAGYRLTAHDKLTAVTVHGASVDANLSARETTGVVQRYRMHYVVRDGVIVAGHATLLSTS